VTNANIEPLCCGDALIRFAIATRSDRQDVPQLEISLSKLPSTSPVGEIIFRMHSDDGRSLKGKPELVKRHGEAHSSCLEVGLLERPEGKELALLGVRRTGAQDCDLSWRKIAMRLREHLFASRQTLDIDTHLAFPGDSAGNESLCVG
jgi:hypothetical protein